MAASLPDSVREEAAAKLLAGYLAELVVRVRAGADARAELDDLLARQVAAVDALRANGTLAKIADTWLASTVGAPVLK